jgi:hypothetical protein
MFDKENEVRIEFEMADDYPAYHRFQDKSLLNDIKFNL